MLRAARLSPLARRGALAAATAIGGAALINNETNEATCGAQPEKFTAPQTLNGKRTYEMKRRLGAGACGVVYEYTDTTNNKSVAVKFPFSGFTDNERKAFTISQQINPNTTYQNHLSPAYEVVELSVLRHGMAAITSGVAVVWGWGGERTLYEDLKKRSMYATKEPLPPGGARLYMEHMMSGLRKLHGAGHIHGDLHMDNVMVHVDKNGKHYVNLIDFGACRETNQKWGDVYPSSYRGGKPPATGFYQHPPELWTEYVQLEAAGYRKVKWQEMRVHRGHDVWSAGVIFFVLLGGDIQKLQKKMVERIEASGGDTSGARKELEDAVAKFDKADAALLKACLEPDASKRASAADVLTQVREARKKGLAAATLSGRAQGRADAGRGE